MVRTVWQVDKGTVAPRLITAYLFRDFMIREHDCVVLTHDLPDESLQTGDVGTVVHIHAEGKAYEVEFVTLTGQTVVVATMLASQLRPVNRRDVTHVRELASI
jgi:hypothetical protein